MERIAEYLQEYSPSQGYGMFGYEGYSIDTAIARDDPDAVRKAHDLGWITPTAETLMGTPIRRLAIERGHEKVAAELASLGYPV